MNYNEINFGLDVLISIVAGASGAIGVWFKLKGKVDIMEVEQDNLRIQFATEIGNLKKEISEASQERKQLMQIISNNKSENELALGGIKELILQMKIDIIQEIHSKR